MGNIEKDMYKGQPLTFGTWLAFAFPEMLLCLLLTWFYLQIYYLPLPFRNLFSKEDDESRALAESERRKEKRVADLIVQKCSELGSWSFKEIQVSIVFLLLVLLWFFRLIYTIAYTIATITWFKARYLSLLVTNATPSQPCTKIIWKIISLYLSNMTKFDFDLKKLELGLI